jgi:tetratricopeptide (TPR) repeat protein
MLEPPSPRALAVAGLLVFWSALLLVVGSTALALGLPLAVAAFVGGRAARDAVDWRQLAVNVARTTERLVADARAAAAARDPRRRELRELTRAAAEHRQHGRVEAAVACSRYALAIAAKLGDRREEAAVLHELGLAFAQAGERKRADECFRRSAKIVRELGGVSAAGRAASPTSTRGSRPLPG